jgi:hypothetical protein
MRVDNLIDINLIDNARLINMLIDDARLLLYWILELQKRVFKLISSTSPSIAY